LLEQLSFNEWLMGASDEIKDNLSFFIGIDIIENYIIAWIMSFGLLGAIPLLLSSFILPLRMVKSMSLNAKVTVLTFAIISISNNALATKTPALLLLSLTLVCLYKKRN
jgi:Sec-independent protein secretion pathway component TatC